MITKIIFIGANRYGEDGPLLDFIDICYEKNIDVFLLTDRARINYPTKTLGTFKKAIEDKGVNFAVLDNLNINTIWPYYAKDDYVICVNCHWIVPPDVIDVFDNKVFNYHNSALPEQKGAACHSWRLMQGVSKSRLTLHEVTPLIDEGRVIVEQEIEYPSECRNLEETYAYLSKFEPNFFTKFLECDCNIRLNQKDVSSFYWPRLNTEIHGFIDWSWSAEEVVQFCSAFDQPFAGASTYLNGVKVRLRNTHLEDYNATFHPFQFGLIYRKQDDAIWVAARSGGVLVKDFVIEGNIKVRLGMRLVTPHNQLYAARLGEKK